MAISLILLVTWTIICWFSEPFAAPFLNFFPFGISYLIPWAITCVLAGVTFVLWLNKHGKLLATRIGQWFDENRKVAIFLILILLLHLLLQLPAIILVAGAHDGDSGVYGIAGFRIAEGEMRPMFNIGKYHMGSLVPHISAIFNATIGQDPVYLRIILTAFYLAFLICLFVLTRKIFGDNIAIVITFLAAIPPQEIFKYLKHPENAVTLFFGTLSFLLLYRILDQEKPSFTDYFVLGWVMGIALWCNYQFVYFIGSVGLFLFLRDWKFYIRPAPWGLVAGMPIGGIPILIHGYFYNWEQFTAFFNNSTVAGAHATPSLITKTSELIDHISTILGLTITRPVFATKSDHIFHQHLTTFFLLIFFCVLVMFILKYKKQIWRNISFSMKKPGAGLFIIFAFVVGLVFSVSQYSGLDSPMRYVLPLWLGVVVFIGAGAFYLKDKIKYATPVIIILFAGLFLASNLLETWNIVRRQGWHQQWVDLLEENNIDRFYGPWIRTYWTNFVTNERIVGTASYPFQWNPVRDYQDQVDNADGGIAYLFDPGREHDVRYMTERLDAVGIDHKRTQMPMGIIIYGFSQRVTAKQFVTLETKKYDGEINIGEPARVDGTFSITKVEVNIINTGKTIWYPHAKNGYLELVVNQRDKELYRLGTERVVKPGEQLTVPVYFDSDKCALSELNFSLQVNEFVLTSSSISSNLVNDTADDENVIDFRSLGQRDLLVSGASYIKGWGRISKSRDKMVRWSSGDSSQILFIAENPADCKLTILLSPFKGDNMPEEAQLVTITINDHKLATIDLTNAERRSFEIDKNYLESGINRITFSYSITEPSYRPKRQNPFFRLKPKAIGLHELTLEKN